MTPILSLIDTPPRHEQAVVGDGKIDVFGISGGDIGEILKRFPNAFQEIADSGSQPIKMNPGLMGALIAACQRTPDGMSSFLGDEKMEAHCRCLDAQTQMQIFWAIGRCTFPDGVGPFLDGLVSLSESTLKVMELIVQIASRSQETPSPPMASEQSDILISGS
jgi:hypothetical protein